MTVVACEGDNRTFKTGSEAVFGWLYYLNNNSIDDIINDRVIPGKVYCTCKLNPNGSFDHTFNFPHEDVLFTDLAEMDLSYCCVITDELDSLADSRMPWDKRIINVTNWNFQVKKSHVTWLWSAVVHDTIDKRIRRNPDFIIENHRVPKDYNKPLQGVIWKVWNRHGGDSPPKIIHVHKPWLWFPLWNSEQKIPHLFNQPRSISIQDEKQLFNQIVR